VWRRDIDVPTGTFSGDYPYLMVGSSAILPHDREGNGPRTKKRIHTETIPSMEADFSREDACAAYLVDTAARWIFGPRCGAVLTHAGQGDAEKWQCYYATRPAIASRISTGTF